MTSVSAKSKTEEALDTREMTRPQSHVLALALTRFNVLMRGPSASGKRWIARHAGHVLTRRCNEVVEIMSKWFTVTSHGQIVIDPNLIAAGLDQIRKCTVLIIENVPAQPHAAASFYAHLDFVCRMERCKTRSTAQIDRTQLERMSFGGIQVIATQDETPEPTTTSSLATTLALAPSHPTSAAGVPLPSLPPLPPLPTQMGLVLNTVAPSASSPHSDVLTIVFR